VSFTRFQVESQEVLKAGKDLLLVAPTGLGKTLAVTADLEERFCKIVYAVPLRALGFSIRDAILRLRRGGSALRPVIHHGDQQESELFGEEVVVTTYDQVVCGVPGLPLSLPLKAGHAVAGALLMSRLILDEAHLAWAISRESLSILLGILDFRRKLSLQTVVLTATLPTDIARAMAKALGMELLIIGQGKVADDEALELRKQNRRVTLKKLELGSVGQKDEKEIDRRPLDDLLRGGDGPRIYFANTVERIQETYDRLNGRIDPQRIIVLHNRMPRRMRTVAEGRVREIFGKGGSQGNWLLLTNQVAEAGLDISAPLVVSDPAPVDTLVQRAGRCARWFRDSAAEGEFHVVSVPATQLRDWTSPYHEIPVAVTLEKMPTARPLSWDEERRWVDRAWGQWKKQKKHDGGNAKDADEADHKSDRVKRFEQDLARAAFALNLFDRAAQNRRPGEIAGAFREILSAEVAVENTDSARDLQALLDSGARPETSSVSLGRAWGLLRSARGDAKVVRYVDGDLSFEPADYVQPGDILVVPSRLAYIHPAKGLCFPKEGEASPQEPGIELSSRWEHDAILSRTLTRTGGRRQDLFEHARGVMDGTRRRLTEPKGTYRSALLRILKSLEPQKDPQAIERLADTVAAIATVAAGLHDLGKADQEWQDRARRIDPGSPPSLIGRTERTFHRIGKPHAHAAFLASVSACEILLGLRHGDPARYLVAAIALAAARHHSAFLNPALVDAKFEPHDSAEGFVRNVLAHVAASEATKARAKEVLEATRSGPQPNAVPLMLPNDDLFPIYALVGRAILAADREDASQKRLEVWQLDNP
jgi:CRISPR-associated endonuclease/helicase Cas3